MNPGSQKIACPACEASFDDVDASQGPGGPEHLATCPVCGYRFQSTSIALDTDRKSDADWQDWLDSLPLPALVSHEATRLRTPTPPLAPPPASPKGPGLSPPPPPRIPELPDQPQPSTPSEPLRHRQVPVLRPKTNGSDWDDVKSVATATGDRVPSDRVPSDRADSDSADGVATAGRHHYARWIWAASALCLLACITVAGWSWWPGIRSGRPASGGASSNGDATNPESTGNGGSRPRWNQLTAVEAARWWGRWAPYVVRLTPPGEDRPAAAGILVDSRGWVLTAGSAGPIDSDWRIELADGAGELPPKTTTLRAVWRDAADPSYQILVVDPTPFAVYADLSFGTAPLDEGVGLAMGVGEGSDWIDEVRIESDPQDRWIVSPGRTRLRPGSPILNDSGDLAGIVLVDGEDHVLRSTMDLADWWIDAEPSIVTNAVPAGELDSIAETTTTARPDVAEGNTPDVTSTSPTMGDALEPPPGDLRSVDVMQQATEALRSIDWTPASPEAYDQAIELVAHVMSAEAIEEDVAIDEGLRVILGRAAEEVRKELQSTPWPSDEDTGKVNLLAWERLDTAPRVWIYGEIVMAPGLAPEIDGGGSAVMKVLGTSHRILLPVTRGFDQLKVGSRWLVWGNAKPRRNVQVEGEDGSPAAAAIIDARYLLAEPEVIVPGRP